MKQTQNLFVSLGKIKLIASLLCLLLFRLFGKARRGMSGGKKKKESPQCRNGWLLNLNLFAASPKAITVEFNGRNPRQS